MHRTPLFEKSLLLLILLLVSSSAYAQGSFLFEIDGHFGGWYREFGQAADGSMVIMSGRQLTSIGPDGSMRSRWKMMNTRISRFSVIANGDMVCSNDPDRYSKYKDSTFQIAHFDVAGNVKASAIFRSPWFANGIGVTVSDDGSVLAMSYDPKTSTKLLIKLNLDLSVRWSRILSNKDTTASSGSIVEGPDNTLLLLSLSNETKPQRGVTLTKLDTNGTVSSCNRYLLPKGITYLTDISGHSDGSISAMFERSTLVQFDTEGRLQYSETFDSLWVGDMIATSDGGVSLATYGGKDLNLIQVSPDGTVAAAACNHIPFSNDYGNGIYRVVLSPWITQSRAVLARTEDHAMCRTSEDASYLVSVGKSLLGCHASPISVPVRTIECTVAAATSAYTLEPFSITGEKLDVTILPDTLGVMTALCAEAAQVPTVSQNEHSPITLSPNPVLSPSQLILHCGSLKGGQYVISVRDLSGRSVYSTTGELSESEVVIPTTALASGIYLLELQDATTFATLWRGKVVVV